MALAPSPVMILGCGRSGTSIFGELFEHLEDYSYRSEPPFAEVIAADFSTPLAFKVPHQSEGLEPDPGLSFPLAAMRRRAPDMRFFWIVRHPLDAVCSLRIGIEQDWGHHPKPPDWRDWLDQPLIARCAHHWAHINSVGFAQVSQIATVVRFEDMISDPIGFAKDVCRVLGVNAHDRESHLADWAQRVQNTNNAQFVEAMTSRAYSRTDHSVRIERWRENLSATEVSTVLPIIAETGRSFGYTWPAK